MHQATSGTSAATYKVMKPHCIRYFMSPCFLTDWSIFLVLSLLLHSALSLLLHRVKVTLRLLYGSNQELRYRENYLSVPLLKLFFLSLSSSLLGYCLTLFFPILLFNSLSQLLSTLCLFTSLPILSNQFLFLRQSLHAKTIKLSQNNQQKTEKVNLNNFLMSPHERERETSLN